MKKNYRKDKNENKQTKGTKIMIYYISVYLIKQKKIKTDKI